MLARFLAPRLARLNIHYGWVVVAVTFATMLITAGAMGLPGVLILSLHKDFGWDIGEISTALALRLALFGLMGPFSAALMERYGVRNVVLAAVALIVTGTLIGPGDDQSLAAGGDVGRSRRGRHRPNRSRAGSCRVEPLVHRPPRSRTRLADREQRHRPARVSATGGLAGDACRLALRTRSFDCRSRLRRSLGRAVHA